MPWLNYTLLLLCSIFATHAGYVEIYYPVVITFWGVYVICM